MPDEDAAPLVHLTRPGAAAEPEGALVLFHGRGADEHDLFPLLDALDPERRLLGVTPRGPLSLPPGGAHWYALGGLPTPNADTFLPTFAQVSAFLDALPVPIERIVLGGFSQGAVMSYALGLGGDRPRPAAIIALSGFFPRVEGFTMDLEGLDGYPIAIAHGSLDQIIPVDFGREAHEMLEETGASVLYRETPVPHTIDPAVVRELRSFIRAATDG